MRQPRYPLSTLIVAVAGAAGAARLMDEAGPAWRVAGATAGAALGAMLVQCVGRRVPLMTTSVGIFLGVALSVNPCLGPVLRFFTIAGALFGLAVELVGLVLRFRHPQFTIREFMLAVAIVAAGLAAWTQLPPGLLP